MRRLSFLEKVFSLTAKIPKGKVTTYKILARKAGRPAAARAVGQALAKNPQVIKVPCHRVVNSNGLIGGYQLGKNKKMKLLKSEGVKIKYGRVLNLKRYLFAF